MSGRVRVDLVPALSVEVGRFSQQYCAERDRLLVARDNVLDVQVEVHLLWLAIRPVGLHVVWGELEGDERLPINMHGVPVVLLEVNRAIDKGRPERALGIEVGGIEHDGVA